MKAVFLSDLHLQDMQERNGEILLRFLRSLQDEFSAGDYVFLLGDIFDLWLSDHDVFVRKFSPVIQCLKSLKRKSVRIVYIEGNHDMHLANFFGDELGAEVHIESQVYDLDGVRVRVEHGDLINLEDKAYLRYRAFVRHPLLQFLAHNLPGEFWNGLGQWASRKSRRYSTAYRQGNDERLIQMIRHHAQRSYAQEKFDVIITGHMHVFDDIVLSVESEENSASKVESDAKKQNDRQDNKQYNKTIRSINLGTWQGISQPKVLLFNSGVWEWKQVSLD